MRIFSSILILFSLTISTFATEGGHIAQIDKALEINIAAKKPSLFLVTDEATCQECLKIRNAFMANPKLVNIAREKFAFSEVTISAERAATREGAIEAMDFLLLSGIPKQGFPSLLFFDARGRHYLSITLSEKTINEETFIELLAESGEWSELVTSLIGENSKIVADQTQPNTTRAKALLELFSVFTEMISTGSTWGWGSEINLLADQGNLTVSAGMFAFLILRETRIQRDLEYKVDEGIDLMNKFITTQAINVELRQTIGISLAQSYLLKGDRLAAKKALEFSKSLDVNSEISDLITKLLEEIESSPN